VGVGFGAERLAREVELLFAGVRLGRADSDALVTEAQTRAFWSRWAAGEYDVVVGTQMVLRACEDAGVGLAAFANADTALNLPDFRAAEWTYRTIRRLLEGAAARRTVIQTFNPGHPAVAAAVAGDYNAFARGELAFRRRLDLPPFVELVNVVVEAVERARADEKAAAVRSHLSEIFKGEARIQGPAPAAVSRVRGRYRRQILVRTSARAVDDVSGALAALAVRKRDVAVRVDVDPYELF
jgi:primosomal protein N' (replication factor Y)